MKVGLDAKGCRLYVNTDQDVTWMISLQSIHIGWDIFTNDIEQCSLIFKP